jgi:hypothetical protein
MIDWLFGSGEEKGKVEIAEDVSGDWTYHLKREGDTKALCGRRTMPSKVTNWGFKRPSHLTISYCSECEQKAANQNLSI